MSPQDLSDRTINSRYHLLRKVGVGGMATVYESIDRELDKRVAVKVLHPRFRDDAEQFERFRQEARTAARVRHEHLVDVTDRGISSEGIPFLVMEFLEGKCLAQELSENSGPIPWERVVTLSIQVCAALEAAHGQGLVHRDIKPGNCFLVARPGQSGDFLKLLDLGIAKVVDGPRDPLAPPSTTVGGFGPGTPEYMAPEQWKGETPDSRTDLYALGVMMYRMLTGTLPFIGVNDQPGLLAHRHCAEPPEPLQKRAPEARIPASIEQIVLRCLSKSPGDRFNNAADLAAALRAAEKAEFPPLPPEVAPETGVKTALSVPQESEHTAPQTLFRAVHRIHRGVLLVACFMTLLLIDLPGVETLAERFRTPAPRPDASRRILPVRTSSAQPVSSLTKAVPTESVRAIPSPLRMERPVELPAEASLPAEPPAATVEEPAPPPPRLTPKLTAPHRKKSEVADPFAEQSPKIAATDARPASSAPPRSPDEMIQRFLDSKVGRFRKCRGMMLDARPMTVDLVVAAGGAVTSAVVRTKGEPEAAECVHEVLVTLKVPGLKEGGEFSKKKVKL